MVKGFYADVETTGLEVGKHEIVQLAYIIEYEGKPSVERNILMRPAHPENADPKALQVIGKTLQELADYPARAEGFKILMKDLESCVKRWDKIDKFTMIGQNVAFDRGFINAFMLAHGEKYHYAFFDHRMIDTLGLASAKKYFGLIDPTNMKLETLCELYSIPLKAHDALEDIRATRTLLYKLMGEKMAVAA